MSLCTIALSAKGMVRLVNYAALPRVLLVRGGTTSTISAPLIVMMKRKSTMTSFNQLQSVLLVADLESTCQAVGVKVASLCTLIDLLQMQLVKKVEIILIKLSFQLH